MPINRKQYPSVFLGEIPYFNISNQSSSGIYNIRLKARRNTKLLRGGPNTLYRVCNSSRPHTESHAQGQVRVERAVTPRGLPKRGPWRRGASDRRDLSCRVSGTQLKGGGKAMPRSLTATEQATKASKTTFRVTRVSSEKQCSRKTLQSLQDEK